MSVPELLKKLLDDRTGATAIEYGLILSFSVLAMMVSLNIIAGNTIGMWDYVSQKVTQNNL